MTGPDGAGTEITGADGAGTEITGADGAGTEVTGSDGGSADMTGSGGVGTDAGLDRELLPVAGARLTWSWLWRQLRARWPNLTFALLVGLLGAVASVVPAYALGALVDRVREH